MLYINEHTIPFAKGVTVKDLAARFKPGADLVIVNGYPVAADIILKDGDICCLIKKGERPGPEEMEHLLAARHSPGVHNKVKKACVGIMGLGGLGSLVAIALARIGIGKLFLCDYDVVEPSNLNRQQYFIDQIGMRKTEALAANIGRINPFVKIKTLDKKLTEESIPRLFDGVHVLAECFDDPQMKAAALRAVRTKMPGIGYVSTSGLAGFGTNNSIRTRKLFPKTYLVGDEVAAAEPGQGLMAPRVGIAAHQQANQILRIILGADD